MRYDNPIIIELEIQEMTNRINSKKKRIKELKAGLDKLEKRVDELLERLNR